ncbi:MAG: crotonase/enoyl-CoA hydratase family protein [Betaproteobacteria bacterium]|nr:crotonase/enoyl-CoA hydratase family protein [Betaproteobacteria bacterium]
MPQTSATTTPELTTLQITLENHIVRVRLNRPDKANAMSRQMWHDIGTAFDWIDAMPEARVAVLSGNGAHFCSGIDLAMLAGVADEVDDDCEGRKREKLRRVVLDLQDTLTSLERCRKPVLAAIHGACVGGGIDLACCGDMRYASAEASFSIKEIDMGMTADVGTLQRLPKLIGDGMVRELAYTGRKFTAEEAARIGFVNRVFESPAALEAGVMAVATDIAAKSPLSIRGTKEMIVYARDHSVADGLNYVATWNAAMLMSSDLQEAMMAGAQKQPPKFRD